MLYFGAHLPKKPTVIAALEEVRRYGGNCLQIFVSNPMSGRHKKKMMQQYAEISEEVIKFLRSNDMKLFIHSPYTLNFGRRVVTPAEAYWVRSFYDELLIASVIGAEGCVIHVGKHLDNTYDDAVNYMYIALKYLVHRVMDEKLNVKIILETAAGQGTEVLATNNNEFQGLFDFYQRFSSRERNVLKICVDTAHLHSAGYDIKDERLVDKLFDNFRHDIALVHLNDSKVKYDSHVDRHERIGKGSIGKPALAYFAMTALQNGIPIILETPDNGYQTEIPWIKSISQKL
jgi:deoxyribonuclease-4